MTNKRKSIDALRIENEGLRQKAALLESHLSKLLQASKNPLDASGISDKLQLLTEELISFCQNRNLSHRLCKKSKSDQESS
jgi:hypothetical protein